jgi:alpha-tubulin suppressor-like RCC1 family protein
VTLEVVSLILVVSIITGVMMIPAKQMNGYAEGGSLITNVNIDAGAFHTLVVKNDGTVWAWGYNTSNQLGDGTSENRYTPVRVARITGIKAGVFTFP